jgi:predicted dinucleotide-binding enzyme
MKVAIVGTGNMGSGLGRQFAAAGHEVFVGSRDPERAEAKAEEIGGIGHGTYADAIAQTDAFLLAVNWWDIDGVFPQLGDVEGKILIDCTNPYTDSTYSTPADLGGRSAADVIQERLPGARVVKAWNHVYAQIVNSSPEFGGQSASVLLAGDDAGRRRRWQGWLATRAMTRSTQGLSGPPSTWRRWLPSWSRSPTWSAREPTRR